MEITPEIVKGAYAYLSETPPFHDWHLPDADDMKFIISGAGKTYGRCHYPPTRMGGRMYVIEISQSYHKHSVTLLNTVAHEMIHVHMNITGMGRNHGKVFKLLAKEVCDAHGFDIGQF